MMAGHGYKVARPIIYMTTNRTLRPRTPHQYEDYTLGEYPAAGQVSCEL